MIAGPFKDPAKSIQHKISRAGKRTQVIDIKRKYARQQRKKQPQM
jgi:hypothetical protein